MSKQIIAGGVAIGGGAPVTIQSMCNTHTEDAKATIAQIHALEEAGCEIVRVTVPNMEAAHALSEIKETTASRRSLMPAVNTRFPSASA